MASWAPLPSWESWRRYRPGQCQPEQFCKMCEGWGGLSWPCHEGTSGTTAWPHSQAGVDVVGVKGSIGPGQADGQRREQTAGGRAELLVRQR